MDSVLDLLKEWNKTSTDREKLQHTYLAVIILVTLIAGVTALITPTLGHQIMIIVIIALVAFVANALVWALLRVYLLDRLDRRRTTKK